MDHQTSLIRTLQSMAILHEVTEQIINWDFSPVSGVGYYSKIEKYAHVAITISASDSHRDKIEWMVSEEQIMEPYRKEILESLEFFSSYLLALKGRTYKSIKIAITDGSFNHDSHRFSFPAATAYALRNCFDKSFGVVDYLGQQRINHAKSQSSNLVRELTRWFPPDAVFESLKDLHLHEKIIVATPHINAEDLNKWCHQENHDELGANFLNGLSQDNAQFFRNNNIISKYDQLTVIGLSHLFIIHNLIEKFAAFGIYDLSPLHGIHRVAEKDYILKDMYNKMLGKE